ncbi:hypothetical protein DFJ58DRAFT_913211 [Suillus subalutaceus]|uniref:uncharacterized protein n=1 Tax=Suillus subalutaceus TaxID=48586 RepID=UPI001B88362C|nr:uncharacterized protein DFJ58DRAFT_913211 [Suillus subalutaceus]KAG1858977.1 hypothetical protein DFJ58DRAFT_913211 [Suillus subalutaceus]
MTSSIQSLSLLEQFVFSICGAELGYSGLVLPVIINRYAQTVRPKGSDNQSSRLIISDSIYVDYRNSVLMLIMGTQVPSSSSLWKFQVEKLFVANDTEGNIGMNEKGYFKI